MLLLSVPRTDAPPQQRPMSPRVLPFPRMPSPEPHLPFAGQAEVALALWVDGREGGSEAGGRGTGLWRVQTITPGGSGTQEGASKVRERRGGGIQRGGPGTHLGDVALLAGHALAAACHCTGRAGKGRGRQGGGGRVT